MSTTLRTRINASLQAFLNSALGTNASGSAAITSAARAAVNEGASYDWPNGSSAGQAARVYYQEATITVGDTPAPLDLTSLTDPVGASLSFASVKAYRIQVIAGTAVLGVGGTFDPHSGSANAQTRTLAVGDCDLIVKPAGIAVGSSNKTITIAATGSGTVTYRLVIVGH